MAGFVEVEAEDAEEAKQLALDEPLPDGDYVEDSFEVDTAIVLKDNGEEDFDNPANIE
jgi:hypothetical protein